MQKKIDKDLIATNDLRKIHSEITQIGNQRFLITTVSIATFATISVWFFPRDDQALTNASINYTYFGSILTMLVLFGLFLFSFQLKQTLRLLSTYLEVSNLSVWEREWSTFRSNNRYSAHSKPQASIFILIGTFAFLTPRLRLAIIGSSPVSNNLVNTQAIVFAIYIIGVLGLGVWGWFDREAKLRELWTKSLRKDDD